MEQNSTFIDYSVIGSHKSCFLAWSSKGREFSYCDGRLCDRRRPRVALASFTVSSILFVRRLKSSAERTTSTDNTMGAIISVMNISMGLCAARQAAVNLGTERVRYREHHCPERSRLPAHVVS